MSRELLRLVGAHEIRLRLDSVSRQRVHQITRRDDFPLPVAVLRQGKVWLAADVDAWITRYRGPRPADDATEQVQPRPQHRLKGRG